MDIEYEMAKEGYELFKDCPPVECHRYEPDPNKKYPGVLDELLDDED